MHYVTLVCYIFIPLGVFCDIAHKYTFFNLYCILNAHVTMMFLKMQCTYFRPVQWSKIQGAGYVHNVQ